MVEEQSSGWNQDEKKLQTILWEAEKAVENGEGWLSLEELKATLEK